MNHSILEKLKKWTRKDKASPEKVQIYPTNKCNLKCIFCAQRLEEYGYEREVSKERWIEIVKEISNMNVNRILISGGGEPFCRRETTLEIMGIVKENGLEGRLITNGTIMNKKTCRRIVEMEWDTLVFSIDGSNANTHDSLRGREGTFGKIMRNVRMLNEVKDDKRFPRLEINFVLNGKNYREVPEMIKLGQNLGTESINFEPLTVNNPRDEKLKLDKEQREELREEIIPEAKKLLESESIELSTNLDVLENIKAEKAGEMKEEIEKAANTQGKASLVDSSCYEPWLWPKIEPNGDVWPCSTAPLHENIKDKPFEEIWFGQKFNEFRDSVKRGNLPEDCENCVTTHVEINKEIRQDLKKGM